MNAHKQWSPDTHRNIDRKTDRQEDRQAVKTGRQTQTHRQKQTHIHTQPTENAKLDNHYFNITYQTLSKLFWIPFDAIIIYIIWYI